MAERQGRWSWSGELDDAAAIPVSGLYRVALCTAEGDPVVPRRFNARATLSAACTSTGRARFEREYQMHLLYDLDVWVPAGTDLSLGLREGEAAARSRFEILDAGALSPASAPSLDPCRIAGWQLRLVKQALAEADRKAADAFAGSNRPLRCRVPGCGKGFRNEKAYADHQRGVHRIGACMAVPYEDEHVAVVVKPQGIAIMGQDKQSRKEAQRRVKETWQELLQLSLERGAAPSAAAPPRPTGQQSNPKCLSATACHRLDQETGGLVVVAKSHLARARITQSFAERRMRKRYRCLVAGRLAGEGCVSAQVDGKDALSRWKAVLSSPSRRYGAVTTVDVEPVTGRKHQIRKHMAALGHPIVGDLDRYFQRGVERAREMGKEWVEVGDTADRSTPHQRLFLFAVHIAFEHPAAGERIAVDIAEPAALGEQRRVEEGTGGQGGRRAVKAVTS